MTTDTMKPIPRRVKAERRALYAQCREVRITHEKIAAEARCDRTYVVHFFAGRRSPRAIELAIEKLLALARNGQKVQR